MPPPATMPTIPDCVLWFKRIGPCYSAQGPTFILKGGREFYNKISSINRVIHTAPTTSSPLMCSLLLVSYRSVEPIVYTCPVPSSKGLLSSIPFVMISLVDWPCCRIRTAPDPPVSLGPYCTCPAYLVCISV